jgi:hypothetical protein
MLISFAFLVIGRCIAGQGHDLSVAEVSSLSTLKMSGKLRPKVDAVSTRTANLSDAELLAEIYDQRTHQVHSPPFGLRDCPQVSTLRWARV